MLSPLSRSTYAVVPAANPEVLDTEAGRIAPRPLTRRQSLTAHLTAAGRAITATHRADEAALVHEARQRALAAIVESWAQALDTWSASWLRVQQAGLERRTQAILLAEYERLEDALRAFTERFHNEIQGSYDEIMALQEAGAHVNIAQSREHEIEMRLHHFHAFVSDMRDQFLSSLRAHAL